MGSLLAKDRLEEARYYAWIDEIGSHAFELEFAGSGGVRYVSTCDTNNGNYYPVAALGSLGAVIAGVECHGMGQVVYGMEKRIF